MKQLFLFLLILSVQGLEVLWSSPKSSAPDICTGGVPFEDERPINTNIDTPRILRDLGISSDGSILAVGTPRDIWLFDTATMELLCSLELGQRRLTSHLNWSRNDYYLLVSYGQQALVWDITTGFPEVLIPSESLIYMMKWSPSGEHIAFVDEDSLSIWDYRNQQIVYREEGGFHPVSGGETLQWSPDGSMFTVTHDIRFVGRIEEFIEIRAAGTWQPITTLNHRFVSNELTAWSPDGRWLATGNSGNELLIWRVEDWQIDRVIPNYQSLYTLEWSPDSQQLAFAGDEYLHVYDLQSGDMHLDIYPLEEDQWVGVSDLVWTHDGTELILALNSDVSALQVWDVATGQPTETVTTNKFIIR